MRVVYPKNSFFLLVFCSGLMAGGARGEPVPDRTALHRAAYQQAAELVGQMTLDEKIQLVEMKSGSVPRLDIPACHWWNEALHGVARRGKATQFPIPLAMASTWNPDLIEAMATAISDEARALHHADSEADQTKMYHGLTLWSPVINMARDPRWGRTEETYGEDPCLTTEMACRFVTGLQGTNPDYLKTVATIKHFVANNTEHNRLEVSPEVSERALREYYFPAYRDTIQRADVESIMSAYNGVNGIPCSANQWLLTDVLRGEWHFNGTVVTDVNVPRWLFMKHLYSKDGVESAALMLKAGVDVYCNGERLWAKQAVEQGLLTEADLDRAVTQSLATRIKLGLLRTDNENPYTTISTNIVGCAGHLALAREMAREGAVLLKNDQQTLPATPEKYKGIILAGPYMSEAPLGGYSGTATQTAASPILGFEKIAGADYKLSNQFGGQWAPVPEANLSPADDPQSVGLKGEYFSGIQCTGEPETVRIDRTIHFDWPKPLEHVDPSIPQPRFAARWTGSLMPNRTGDHVFSMTAVTGAKVWLDGRLILDLWDQKSPETAISPPVLLTANQRVPLKVEYYDKGSDVAKAQLQWIEPQVKKDAGNPAEELLVYVGGLTHEMSHESKDLMDLSIPKEQIDEIAELAKTYPHMVVVLNGGTMMQLNALNPLVPAVLLQWFPGQEGGYALAEIVTGAVNPSGRLPLTFYTDVQKLPDFEDYELTKGRTYMYMTNNVTYPFGYGISYTTFDYRNLVVQQDGTKITATMDVVNTGAMEGHDVVQLYVSNLDSPVTQPIRALKAFQRVAVKQGETVRVDMTFRQDDLAWWDESLQQYRVNPGRYEVQVGRSASDILQKRTFTVE
jgi:beta-glucosidase